MVPFVLTDRVWHLFLEAAVLLHTLDPVHGEQEREQFLKRKILDSFALLCAASKGGDNVSAACMEEGQPEGTVVRLASNGGVSPEALAQARNLIACGGMPSLSFFMVYVIESTTEKEADILSKIVHLDISRLRGHVCDVRSHRNMIIRSRPKIPEQVLKILLDLTQSAMEEFLEWLDSMLRMDGLNENLQSAFIARYIKLAPSAKHNYLEPLNALFSMEVFN